MGIVTRAIDTIRPAAPGPKREPDYRIIKIESSSVIDFGPGSATSCVSSPTHQTTTAAGVRSTSQTLLEPLVTG